MNTSIGTLYIVGTPIGNLGDISVRAKQVFESVDMILCEDTRVSQVLLQSIDIKKPLKSYHQHSTDLRVKEIADWLREGLSLALISDAGTPSISDPGGKLVQALVREFRDDLKVVPIPGPSALISALSVSGFPADEFLFMGFPPHKKGRQSFFRRAADWSSTVAFYESTHRIMKCLEELKELCPHRLMMVGRELTKHHETIYRGTAEHIIDSLSHTSIKGEFVVVIAPKTFTDYAKD